MYTLVIDLFHIMLILKFSLKLKLELSEK